MFTLNCKGKLLVIDRPIVMGILNITQDSFYSGSRYFLIDQALAKAKQMIDEGATILDIGGQSTRPGSSRLSISDELSKVLPAIDAIHQQFPDTLISIDTFYSKVSIEAVKQGASIVNDISGGSFDEDMMKTVADLQVPYICMHMKGSFESMHTSPFYENVTLEVLDYFIQKLNTFNKAGIKDMILDPGLGFSKNATHNFQLLKEWETFQMLKRPLLLGISRKSTIYKTLGISVEDALNGSTVLHTAGLLKGANILRVHDVKEAMEAVTLTEMIK
jgi:dihydropteroate synthase